MDHLNIKRFGLAAGATMAVFYLGCILITLLVSTEMSVGLLNNMMHSIDFSTLIRKTPIPFTEALVGAVAWFITGWVIGTGIAFIYNSTFKAKTA